MRHLLIVLGGIFVLLVTGATAYAQVPGETRIIHSKSSPQDDKKKKANFYRPVPQKGDASTGYHPKRAFLKKKQRREEKNEQTVNGKAIYKDISKKQINRKEAKSEEMKKGEPIMHKLSSKARRREEVKSGETVDGGAIYHSVPKHEAPKIGRNRNPSLEEMEKAGRNTHYAKLSHKNPRRRYENVHQSADQAGRKWQKSYEAKERYRKRKLWLSRLNPRNFMPVYMREKPEKPKHDKSEKGLWYE
ncbi:hypothetical protein SAMN05421823_10815 [Catalinimonas alkaloidigena]|uniref:Uncharacterized protein n=1 Tax=Catalinimonas alkaloidigena TaxID=1075417 RepID=A0A1G9MLT8_9BACT|nr:hypothetical protein [Catalinimonas alkaloidigena]SDL74867.1 hypothetical protein SAMN05421823_10815 [Catalinimonas alkaloidigena]